MSQTAATPQTISIADYDYPLPESRIASHPLACRDACRLLVSRRDGSIDHRRFSELPGLLPEGAMLVCNDTRVVNARLRFRKGGTEEGALIEVFCLEPQEPADYATAFGSSGPLRFTCYVGNSKRWKEGELTLQPAPGLTLKARRVTRPSAGEPASVVEFSWEAADGPLSWAEVLEAAGEIPIPPYLNRQSEASDTADYQTVFNRYEGSVAAPTAGLHFTPALLAALDAAGIERRELTLHVGAGTFSPVKADTLGGHQMHSEFISVPLALIREIASTGRPVIAVGTTSVRTLESVHHIGRLMAAGRWQGELPQWTPYDTTLPSMSRSESYAVVAEWLQARGLDRLTASTRLLIAPGYAYAVADGMVTNFHQPKSTLLLLVSAWLGNRGGGWRELYRQALEHPDYRFLSYGDACLLL